MNAHKHPGRDGSSDKWSCRADIQADKTNIQSKIAISTRCHDIFALEFLSDNHNILLSGGRGPYLDIIDLRANSLNPQVSELSIPTSLIMITV